MKIKSIEATNLKGKSFRHELGDITVFTGQNDAGKSSRLDCIPLALFGYHRSLGKANQSIFKLSSGAQMTATVEMDDGSIMTRGWSESRGSVKADVAGNVHSSIIPLGFDAAEYFNLSDRERVKLAFKLSKCDTDFATVVIAKAKSIRLDEHDDAAEQVVQSVCKTIMGLEVAKDSTVNGQEWLESCAEFAKMKHSTTSAAAKKMASTVEGLSELRARAAAPVNSAAEKQLAELNRKIADATAAKQAAETAREQARKRYARKVELESALAKNPPNVSAIAAELARLEEECSSYASKTQGLLAEKQAVEAKAASELQIRRGLERELAMLKERKSELLRASEAGGKPVEALKQKLGSVLSLEACPYCECAGDGWNDKVKQKIVAELALAQGDCNQVLKHSNEKLAEMDKRTKEIVGEMLTLCGQDIVNQSRLLETEASLIDSRNRDAEHKQRLSDISNLRIKLRNATAEQELSVKLQGELDSLADAREPESEGPRRHAALLAELQAKVQPLTLEVRQANASKGETANKLKAAEEANKVALEAQCWKEVKAIVDEIQQEAVDKAIGPILDRANKIAAAILPSPLAYHEGRIGRWGNKKFIPCETFGGSAQAVTYAAVAVALASSSGCECRVAIVDEMDRLTQENKVKLIGEVKAAIADGLLDQFVGADVRGSDYVGVEGVDVVNVK